MAKHRYPRNLHAILRRRWRGEPLADGWPRVDLPEKAILDELLDVCYHASLLTEEGRPTIFRIAFIAGSTPVSPPLREPVPLEPIMRYALCPPVPFTVGELRRLAPVADPRRVLIAVEQIEETPAGTTPEASTAPAAEEPRSEAGEGEAAQAEGGQEPAAQGEAGPPPAPAAGEPTPPEWVQPASGPERAASEPSTGPPREPEQPQQPASEPQPQPEQSTPKPQAAQPPPEQLVNLNTATFEELRSANLSVTQATRVLAHRERRGGYSSIDDLDEVPGFPDEVLDDFKRRVTV